MASPDTAMQAREYQLECLKRILAGNTIVNMPTGTGKTFVAVLAIKHFMESGKVLFVVPTRALVQQQAHCVRSQSSGAKVIEIAESQSEERWTKIVQHYDVFVGTPEVFRRALVTNRYITMDIFSLLIFDECHNATGNSPMAGIMRDAQHRCSPTHQPRILGLTASFVNGKLTDIEEKRRDLEGLLQSKIFCPDIEARPTDYESVTFEETDTADSQAIVKDALENLLGIAIKGGVPFDGKETKAGIQRGMHVFTELGGDGLAHYINGNVVPQLEPKIKEAGKSNADAFIRQVKEAAASFVGGNLKKLPRLTNKAQKLMELLRAILEENGGRPPRIIVFSEQIIVAVPMAKCIETEVLKGSNFRAAACTGGSGMTDNERNQVLSDFRNGRTPVLACTAAIEEGLDVSSCEVVVRYTQVKTTKSHIQGAGRARASNARVYYFDNDPDAERKRAQLLEEIAKKEALSLTEDQFEERRVRKDVEGVHPHKTETGAEISLFSCTQIVNEYVSKCMQQTFRPDENLLKYESEVVCNNPKQVRQRLVEMEVPSPNGFFKVTADDVDNYWGEIDISDVADEGRIKNWKPKDRDARRFYFVVAVELSKRGFLDSNNQPTSRAVNHTRHVCRAWTVDGGANLNMRFDSDARGPAREAEGPISSEAKDSKSILNQLCTQLFNAPAKYTTDPDGTSFRSTVVLPDGSSYACPDTASSKKDAEQKAAQEALLHFPSSAMPRPSLSPDAGAPSTAAADAQRNFKMELNNKTGGRYNYETVDVPGGFRSTVILLDGTRFSGEVKPNKKEAEQSAAAEAMSALSKPRQPKPSEPGPTDVHSAAAASGGAVANGTDEGRRGSDAEKGWANALCRRTGPLSTEAASRLPEPSGAALQSPGVVRNGTDMEPSAGAPQASARPADAPGTALQSPGVLRNGANTGTPAGGDLASTARPADVPPGPSYQSAGLVRNIAEADSVGQDDVGVSYKTMLSNSTNGRAEYSFELQAVGGFIATVRIPGNDEWGTFASPVPCQKKKDAEEAAAKAALKFLKPQDASLTNSSARPNKDAKSRLNELTNGGAKYLPMREVPGEFLMRVTLPDGRAFEGAPDRTKKGAEQAAAQAALLGLESRAPEKEPHDERQGGVPTTGFVPVGDSPNESQAGAADLAGRLKALLRERGQLLLQDLVRLTDAPKKEVNQQLYALEKHGEAKKVQDTPPLWANVP